MTKASRQMPDILEALCTVAAQKVQDFNAQEVANMLWAMVKTCTQRFAVFEAL